MGYREKGSRIVMRMLEQCHKIRSASDRKLEVPAGDVSDAEDDTTYGHAESVGA
jgi:hypothetical protein